MKKFMMKRFVGMPQEITTRNHRTSTDYEVNAVIKTLEAFKLFLINKSEITIRIDCEAIVAYGSQQINTDKKTSQKIAFIPRIGLS